jgi:hypothetical protein
MCEHDLVEFCIYCCADDHEILALVRIELLAGSWVRSSFLRADKAAEAPDAG